MITDCPDPREVSDFHFRQLRTLRLIKENEQIPTKYVNLLTCASKYDLLFVGVGGGFKVLKLEDILTLDEDKENRNILEKYPFSFVSCDTPTLLAVNATQTVLAVCTKSVAGTVLLFYSLANFPGSDSPWQPFCSQVFSNTELIDFAWNPALEGLYSFCLSDGSLHIHEISGTTIKPNATLSNAKALAVCWSPKGKQLVVGKDDGSFIQCKPTLDVVNTIMPPALEDGPVHVTSICWISTTVFAVVYVTNENPTPYLFIVSTPKGQPITYTNFNDVCLGNNSIPDQKYLMHLEPSWRLLICASFDSIEIAVLGDMPNWVQWDLREDGKALLPGKDGALNATGMTVMYSAQKQIIISDSLSYPPMPVIFVLTNNGLLVSFHMVNEKSDAPTLVSAPVPTAFKICSANGSSLANTGSGTDEMSERKSFMPSTPSLISPTPVTGKSVSSSQIPVSVNLSQNVSLGMEAKSAFTLSNGQNLPNLPSSGNQTFAVSLNKSEAVRASSTFENEKHSHLQTSPAFFASGKENEVKSSTENSYMTAIISEIQSFEKELQDLKQLQNSLPAISVEEDMSSLKVFALNLENFQKDITETMQSLSSDIYTLKNVLLESFVLFEEASSRERRRNDHSYITMLKERALDPITARRMQKINQLFQYLNTQLQEVSNKLDQDWIHHVSQKEKMLRNNFSISSTEAIYKTIVNNQKIIHNFRKKVDQLQKRAEEKRLRNITNSGSRIRHHKRLPQEDLSKLADEFLQVKITHKEEGDTTQTKKLSPESQNFLKDFLKKSSVVTVRPTAVYSLSQSRLLSNTVPFDDSSGSDQTQDISPKGIHPGYFTAASSDKQINKKSSPMFEDLNAVTILKQPKESTPVKPYLPVYEPITPPDTVFEPVIKSVTSLSKESNPEILSHPSSMSTTMNLEQGVGSSLFSNVKNNKEFPKFSFSAEMKSPLFKQATSEPVSSSSTIFSKTFSFAPSILKDSESSVSKPLTVNNSSGSSPAPGFQFGQKRDSFWSVSSTAAPPAVVSTFKPDLNNSVTSENSKWIQQDKPLEPSSNSIIIVSSSSIAPVPKTTMSAPLVMTAEKKTSQSAQDNENLPVIQPLKNTGNTGFFFGSNKAEQETKKDNSFANSGFLSGEGFNFSSNSVNKTVSAITQSPSSQQQNIFVDSLKSVNNSASSSVLSSKVEINVPKTDNTVDASNELKVSSTDLKELKQPALLTDGSSEPVNLSLSTLEVESVVSTVPSLTITTVSSVTSTETITSQSSLSISKPPSPPLTTLPPQTSVSSATLFGQAVSTTSSDISKTCKSDVPTTSNSQMIGQPQSETPSFFSSPKTDISTSSEISTTQTTFGQQSVSTTVPQATPFGQQPVSTTVSQVTPFGQPPPTSVAQTTLFGQPPSTTVSQPNLFGQPSSTTLTQTTPFGQPAAASVTQTSLFGQPTSTSSFSSTAGGFFSQTPAFGASDATTAVTSANSDFTSQSSTFSFGKPAFGQTAGSFGLAKSFFGQNTTSVTQSSTPSSFSFNQNSGNAFGQGSFFSGLGGKPSEENASKNVFGIGSSVKSDTNNLFKNSSVKSFGTVNTNSFSGAGSFSSGGASVAQSGFGSFQQTPTQQSGGFGSAPTFGGSPAFGSPPAFGGSPAFGSAPVFGQQQVSSNFSNFANASSPTFGSLASQTTGFGSSPGFGSPPSFGTPAPAFGSPAPAFGGQSPGFGSPGSPPSNSSAFSQWRN